MGLSSAWSGDVQAAEEALKQGLEFCPGALFDRVCSERKRAELLRLGVELVEGDLKDPASLAAACAGVQAVVSTASSTFSRQPGDSIESVDRQGQLALVDAARKGGVEHFVFVSFRENLKIDYPLRAAKRAVEQALKTSGMAYTILQASYFTEIWLTPALGFDVANGKARLYGDGSRPISWISYRDVARAAVTANHRAERPEHDRGDRGTSGAQPPRRRTDVRSGGAGEIATESVHESALESQMNAATDPLQKSFAGLMLQCAGGDSIDITTSKRLFPFPMTSVRDYITAQLRGPEAHDAKWTVLRLVHGAWQTAATWDLVRPRLAESGRRVFNALLTGLETDAHALTAAVTLDTHTRNVVAAAGA